MKYRKDINGLRAIAVMTVLVFHFTPELLPGGFTGVDVFFVISGFLMTKIIVSKLETNSFGLLDFYMARANRILPALTFLCFVIIVFGWFFVTPTDYSQLGKYAASSLLFVSNIIYFREAGYFDAASLDKWLLHTWSLSVEWQFYLVYPLILIALIKLFGFNRLKNVLLGLTVICFIVAMYISHHDPSYSYYALSARAWEMLLGGLAFLFPFKIKSRVVELAGLFLVILSVIFISEKNLWPGPATIFPVLGAFLIIQSQRAENTLLSNPLFQRLGLYSYSIYLWHWPIVVFIYYFKLPEVYIIVGMLFSLVLGYCSYTFIETLSFRKQRYTIVGLLKNKLLYTSGLVAIVGAYLFFSQGARFHYSHEVLVANDEVFNNNPYGCMESNVGQQEPCFIGDKNNIVAIVVGDSHADAIYTALTSNYDLASTGFIVLNKSSCPFILNATIKGLNNTCFQENKFRMKFLADNYEDLPVYWIARTGVYLYGQSDPKRIRSKAGEAAMIGFNNASELHEGLKENLALTICSVSQSRPVFMLQPIPEMRTNVPTELAKRIMLNYSEEVRISISMYLDRNEKVRQIISDVASMCNAQVLDPLPYLCDESDCFGSNSGRAYYYDGDHLSEFGNKLLKQMFKTESESTP